MLRNTDIDDLLEAIKNNNSTILKRLYQNNYKKVEVLILKNSGSMDHAKDIFQEAFLVTWQKIKTGVFIPNSESSINGFIYTVAKNKWLDVLRSKSHKSTLVMSQIEGLQISDEENHDAEEDQNNEQLDHVMTAFASLGEACKTLLKMFYYEKKSMNEIANDLSLDAASTRNKKYRCMQRLKKIALNNT